MDKNKIRELLENIQNGSTKIDDAIETLKALPFEDMGFAKLDNHRSLRKGFPEVIFCQGKTVDQVKKIAEKLSSKHDSIIATRAEKKVYSAVKEICNNVTYHEAARFIRIGNTPKPLSDKKILVMTAGTSDIPVAEEAALTAESMGNHVDRLFDVGVAGIHRLFSGVEKFQKANIIIVAAGMDGALPSIIGGMVGRPVIAVPTSVGYGASFHGVAALLTMLNSCAPGVVTVNIDNGFGAGYAASMMNSSE